MIKLNEKVALLPVKHNTQSSILDVKWVLKKVIHQQNLKVSFLLELNT